MGPDLDLRPQLERLDRLMLRSEGLDPAPLTFAFRPLWQLDAASAAAIALQKAQATQIYAGLGLWPAAVTARLVEAQLVQDGTYPNASAVFAEGNASPASPTRDYDPNEPRDLRRRWARDSAPASRRGGAAHQPEDLPWFLNLLNPVGTAQAQEVPPDEPARRANDPIDENDLTPGEALRLRNFNDVWEALRNIDPRNPALQSLRAPGMGPSEAEIVWLEGAVRRAKIASWRSAESRMEKSSPLNPFPNRQQSALERHYGNPQSPGLFESTLYPEIETGPEGVDFKPEGDTAVKRGASYEKWIVDRFDLDKPGDAWYARRLQPDAVESDIAVEVKYTDDFSRSMYNPYRGILFLYKEINATIEQAIKYTH